MLKSPIQIMKHIVKYLSSLTPLFRAKAVIPEVEAGKKFTNGVRYMIDELRSINAVDAANDITDALKMTHASGRMDIDVFATYLNIARGYKVSYVRRDNNRILIYFDISEQPIILAPKGS